MECFKEMLEKKVGYKKLDFDLIFSETISKELHWYLDDTEAALLAMLERKDNTFFEKYLRRDLVKQMVSEITVPLLSFNANSL